MFKCLSSRFKLWTGWRDRPVGSVERLMGKSDRSSACPMDVWPTVQSATLIPGSNLEKAAGILLVNMVAPTLSSFIHRLEISPSILLVTGCLMKYESVKLDKQMFIEGQESKCFSVEPVLRCLPGCSPVRTTQANIGFHCVPAGEFAEPYTHTLKRNDYSSMLSALSLSVDTNLNRAEVQSSMFDKSVDVKETTEAHLACRCSVQCP